MEINGVAHIMLTVSNYEACAPFYEKLLGSFGMVPVINADGFLYCVGGRTACGIQRADAKYQKERFVQARIGMHHVCFRAREREDVDKVHVLAQELGAKTVHPPEEGAWAPGYYSVLSDEPILDSIRFTVTVGA